MKYFKKTIIILLVLLLANIKASDKKTADNFRKWQLINKQLSLMSDKDLYKFCIKNHELLVYNNSWIDSNNYIRIAVSYYYLSPKLNIKKELKK